jgi:hypothetical protein
LTVVEHDVQFATRVLARDELHEAQEIRRGVALGAGVDHFTSRHVQRRVQIEHPVPLVVVRVSCCSSLAQRQRQLRALERLDLRLLVDAQHDRVVWRVEVQADDILHLLREGWVLADLVRAHQVRLEAVRSQDLGDRRAGQLELLRQQARRPPRPARRRRGQRRLNDPL